VGPGLLGGLGGGFEGDFVVGDVDDMECVVVGWRSRSREAFLFRSRLRRTMNQVELPTKFWCTRLKAYRHASRGLVCVSHITSCITCRLVCNRTPSGGLSSVNSRR
jgi:hypothetical protein